MVSILSKPIELDRNQVVAIAAGSGGLAVVYLVYRYLNQSRKYKAPFAEDVRRAREPMETNREKRNLRIKKKFEVELVPTTLDAIVIGSGIGGMTVAAVLAKTGRRVLVLEQHGKLGGWCHTFTKDGAEFDVGIHYVGKMGKDDFNRFVVDQLTEGQLDFQELVDDFDNVTLEYPDSKKIVNVPVHKRDKYMETLIARYPHEEKGIREFFRLAKDAASATGWFVIFKVLPRWLCRLMVALRWPFFPGLSKFLYYFNEVTCQDVMDKLVPHNKELQVCLSYIWGDSGSPPRQSPFGVIAAIHGHYARGAFYPVGGSNEMPYHMVPIIERAGGQVLMRAKVTEILMSQDQKTAVGVRVEYGKNKLVDIRAPLVISDAGVPNTFTRLLPAPVAQRTELAELLRSKRLKPSISMMQVFIGLQGSQEELELPSRNYWVSYSYTADDLDKWTSLSLEEASTQRVPMMFLGFPSAKDPEYGHKLPDRSACIAITIVPTRWFKSWATARKGKRGEEYKDYKMAIAEQMWEQVLEMFPQLSDRRRYFDAATPVTAEYYNYSVEGESYGLDHGIGRFSPEIAMALRPKVAEVNNLYLTGQDIVTCGFGSALAGGLLCAHSILAENGETYHLYKDIGKLFRRCKAKAN